MCPLYMQTALSVTIVDQWPSHCFSWFCLFNASLTMRTHSGFLTEAPSCLVLVPIICTQEFILHSSFPMCITHIFSFDFYYNSWRIKIVITSLLMRKALTVFDGARMRLLVSWLWVKSPLFSPGLIIYTFKSQSIFYKYYSNDTVDLYLILL